jgi:hypothetical protein
MLRGRACYVLPGIPIFLYLNVQEGHSAKVTRSARPLPTLVPMLLNSGFVQLPRINVSPAVALQRAAVYFVVTLSEIRDFCATSRVPGTPGANANANSTSRE